MGPGRCEIRHVHKLVAASNIAECGRIGEIYWAPEKFRIRGGQPVHGDRVEPLVVINPQNAKLGLAQFGRLFEHRVEHRSEVAGRRIDDLQHLGGRGLLLQGLARLGNEPRVLHRDHRLRREIFQQRDLLVGERPDFLTIGGDIAE